MRASRRSSPVLRCRCSRSSTAIRRRSSCSVWRRRWRSSSCTAPTWDGCAREPRAASTSDGQRVRRLLLVAAVAAAALWLAPGAFAAGWCGTGETSADLPDAVTGQQVHAIVAAPADGADNFAADAGALADDVAAIDAWWQTQDPTRIPRFDQAA